MRLFDALDLHGDNPALIDANGQVITYQELVEIADSLVRPIGQRQLIFCLCSNSVESIVGYVGLQRAGHVCVMLTSSIEPERFGELARMFRPNYVYAPSEVMSDLGLEQLYGGNSHTFGLLSDSMVAMNPDLALLMTTSGSTGSPMMVRVSYANLISNAESIALSLGLTAQDRALTTLPMNYTYGLSIINSQLHVGGSIVVSNASLMDRQFWNLVANSGATYFGGVPYTYQMLERIGLRRLAGSTLRMLTQAGGRLDPDAVLRIHGELSNAGIELNVMYGQTEATARMSVLRSADVPEHPWSIGEPIPGGELRVVDPDTGEEVDDGEVGELEYQGPNVTMGYALSSTDLIHGDTFGTTLRTGDLARRESDGFLRIVGRRKRFVKVFGNRVNLDDVEKMLNDEGVECACTGIDDLISVHVVSPGRTDIQDVAARYIGANRNAVIVRVVGNLPRAESGKILYAELSKGVSDGIA